MTEATRLYRQEHSMDAFFMQARRSFTPLSLVILLFPTLCNAHALHGTGFLAGLTHPALGMDHLLAMLSVGILSALIGGHALWLLPVTFVSVMVLGGGVALSDIVIHGQESGISLSVVILGAAIAFGRKIPTAPTLSFVALFAFFHGYAHGAELPGGTSAQLFIAGFAIGTAVIHVLGVFIGHFASHNGRTLMALRFAGAFFSGIGFHILTGLR